MADESYLLDGLELNRFPFLANEIEFTPPRKKWVMAGGARADGDKPVGAPKFENRQIPFKLRIIASDRSQLEALFGQVIDKIEKASQSDDGIDFVWTPKDSTNSMTFKVLGAEVGDLPINISGGMLANLPEIPINLICKPFGYGSPIEPVLDDFGVLPASIASYTNLVTNPSFEIDTTGWIQYVGGGTLPTFTTWARDLGWAAAGAASLKVVTSAAGIVAGAACGAAYDSSCTPGQTYCFDASVNVSTPNNANLWAELLIEWRTLPGAGSVISYSGGSVTRTTSGSGIKTLGVNVTAPAGAFGVRIYVRVIADITVAQAITFYIDSVLQAATANAVTYFDGDQGTPSYRWTGAPHASTSQQTSTPYLAPDGFANTYIGNGVLNITLNNITRRFIYDKESYGDAQATVKWFGGSSFGNLNGVVLKYIDANNYIRIVNNSGGLLQIDKIENGVVTTLASVNVGNSVGMTRWIRGRIEGNLITAERWTAAPTPTGAPEIGPLTFRLVGNDAAKYGVGVLGKFGILMNPDNGTVTMDDFKLEPYTYVQSSSDPILSTPPIYGIKGDVAAEGELTIWEASNQARRHLEWGLEQTTPGSSPVQITDLFSTNTITSGQWAFDAGSGTLSISGGLLVPSSTAEKRIYRTDCKYTDVKVRVKYTTDSVAAGADIGIVLRIDANNYLLFQRAGTTLAIKKFESGSFTTLTSTAIAAQSTNFSYWLEAQIIGNHMMVNVYTSDPEAVIGGTLASWSGDLTGADATKFGTGVQKSAGLRLIPAGTGERYDNFIVYPLLDFKDYFIGSDFMQGFPGNKTGAHQSGAFANHVVVNQWLKQSQPVAALPLLGHVGTYRVKARMWMYPGRDFSVRLTWWTGTGPRKSNAWTAPRNDLIIPTFDPVNQSTFFEVDLGTVTINRVTEGQHFWTGYIEGQISPGSVFGSSFQFLDYVELIPVERYGRAAIPLSAYEDPPPFLDIYDSVDQTAGALTGKQTTAATTWTFGHGDANDYTVNATEHRIERSQLGGSPRIELISSGGIYTDLGLQADIATTSAGTAGTGNMPFPGLAFRYVNSTNYAAIYFWPGANGGVGNPSGAAIKIDKIVAGVTTPLVNQVFVPNAAMTTSTFYTLRIVVGRDGKYWVWVNRQLVAVGFDSAFATGGALESGKVGLYDVSAISPASTRWWDNILVFVPQNLNTAVLASGSRSIIAHDRAVSARPSVGNIEGVGQPELFGKMPNYVGSRLYVPNDGADRNPTRLVVKARRNDISINGAPDDVISDVMMAQLSYYPRYVVIPR